MEFFEGPSAHDQREKKVENYSIRTSPGNKEESIMSSKRTSKDRSMRPNFNINLSIYRKKFKEKMLSKENSPKKIGFNFSVVNPNSCKNMYKDFTRNTINFTELNSYNRKISR